MEEPSNIECDLDLLPGGTALANPKLLVVPLGQFRRDGRQETKQSLRLVVWSSSEENLSRRFARGVPVVRAYIARAKRPDTIDHERLSVRIL